MQTIYLDISNKGVTPRIYAKQSDVGRKFVAVMTDGGVPFEIPEDALISIWYEGASGSGNYTDIGNESAISVSKNLISVELIHQMLAVPGCGEITIVVNSADGKQIGFWNIQYDVERVAGWGSEGAKDYFSAFSNATENLVEASRLFLTDETLTKQGRPADAYESGLRISALEGRVNELSSLPDGSTTGDAELADARVGYDGKSYQNVGEHIRDVGKLAHSTSFAAENLVGNIPILVSRSKSSNGGLANYYKTEMKVTGNAKYLATIDVPVSIDRSGGFNGTHSSVVSVYNGRISTTEPIATEWFDIPDGESSGTATVNVGEWFLPGDTIIVLVLDARTDGIILYPMAIEPLKVDWIEDQIGEVDFPGEGGSEYNEVRFVGTATFYDTLKNEAKTYISHDKQTLTTEQQVQARENIGITSDERYYPDLANAINDVNNGTTEEAITNISAAKVKVFTAENGRLTAMLLDDDSENSQITVNKDIDIVLNGKTLTGTTATTLLTFGEGTKCVINGEVEGSKIKWADGVSSSVTTPLIQADGKELAVNGGTYLATHSSTKSVMGIRQGEVEGAHLIVNGCTVDCHNTGTGNATALYGQFKTYMTVKNCSITSISEQKTAKGIIASDVFTIDDSYIYARTDAPYSKGGGNPSSCGITTRERHDVICRISTSKIVADARGNDADEPSGVGISNMCSLIMKDTDSFGTHSGVQNQNGGKLYVSGGTFTGHSHGGFYFCSGAEGEAFVKDAVIRCGNYEGIFTEEFAEGNTTDNIEMAGFYVGGGDNENNSNVTVYLDGCTIGYPGKPAFVIRGTSGEQNCTVNISNSTIVDDALPIRIDNETHKLNVGIGGNITTDKIDNPQWAEFTGKNYRQYNEDETVDGKDCAALQNQTESSVRFTEQAMTPAQQAQAMENIGVEHYYHAAREEFSKPIGEITSAYIFGLYDALMEQYPGKIAKNEIHNDDGTFTNYEYVISTGQYNTEGIRGTLDTDIKKPKYLVMSGIHGREKAVMMSLYRFVRDVLSGHNVPSHFLESAEIHVVPCVTPYSIDTTDRNNANGVNINRNFDWEWNKSSISGAYAASEKETQAIVNWLNANKDASLFIDLHNSGNPHEVSMVFGLKDNEAVNIAKRTYLQGIDRVIPFWRDVIKYTAHKVAVRVGTADETIEVREPVFSYSSYVENGGVAVHYATGELGIPSLAMETTICANADYVTDELADITKAYSAETIAAGADAIGNTLLEFYKLHSIRGDIMNNNMANILGDVESALDAIIQMQSPMTGEIENALDSIAEMQNSMIGGEKV